MRVLTDIDVSGKRVFVRADLDVPIEATNPSINSGQAVLTSNAEIATRLTNLKETVDYLLEHGAGQVIIAGHIDRPKGPDSALSTKQLKLNLEKILSRSVIFAENFEKQVLENLVLLENLRFWPGETQNDQSFAHQLANLADIYINEAFGNCHRNHASMVALPSLFADVEDPDGVYSRRAAGFHLAKEVEELTKILNVPEKPFVAIVGGAKIETKLPLVEHLAKTADFVLVGGELPIEIRERKMTFPQNVLVASLTSDAKDISDESVKQFCDVIASAKTVVWNGPLGLFEEGFDKGSKATARAIIESPAYEVVGGGETVEFLAKNNLLSHFAFVSSGGGAMLEFLAGKKLPALEALN